MRAASRLLVIAGLGLPLGLAAMDVSAAETVAHFRLAPDRQNGSDCGGLNAVLARVHTITVRGGDVELTSAGGIEGRMSELKTGLYRIIFELEGKRVDAVADLASTPVMLTVTERNRPCRWLAAAQ
jgi:hypothetical protein